MLKIISVCCFLASMQIPALADVATIDFRALVSRADLDYDKPTVRSEEGHPIGNGRMGSLVWTTPSAIHFQINRCDVFGQDSNTVSFPKQDSDYASDCGYVDINVASVGPDAFAGEKFNQHLNLYDALDTISANRVSARVLALPQQDVMAIEIDDQREQPQPINVDLRMLRFQIQNITGKNYQLTQEHAVEVHTAEHTALSDLDILGQRIALVQKFTEAQHYSASAVVIGASGRDTKARYLNESTVELSAPAARGKLVILIGTAASLKSADDVEAIANQQVESVAKHSFEDLQQQTQSWWHDFWSRGFVYMHSADGQADFVEQNYTYFLYLMGSSSRGAYPPRFGGMLWYTNADMRRWGSQYWWSNESAYYSNLMPANRLDLMNPLFNLYSGMIDNCAKAAKEQWGSSGVWIPEITFFNGLDDLPADVASELQDLMLCRKDYEQRSAKFQWWVETKNRHNSRYNFLGDGHYEHGHYVVPTKGAGIFGHCTHILSDAAKIGNLFYQRYLFTRDQDWLRDRAYPIVKGAAEFYRNFPNVSKGDDGKYHIHHVNNGESAWDSDDPPNEIAGMQMAFSNAIIVAMLLNVDADLVPKWKQMLENLAPPGAVRAGRAPPRQARNENARQSTSRPAKADAPGEQPATDRATSDRATTERAASDRATTERGGRVFGSFVYGGPGAIPPKEPDAQQKAHFLGFTGLGSFIDPAGDGGAQIFRNRLRLREGPGAIDAEHIAGLTMGIHSTLLDSAPDQDLNPRIEVFTDTWPRSWDCAFTLLARGGFLVTSSLKNRQVQFVQVKSQLGESCRLRNPWPEQEAVLYRDGAKSEMSKDEWITFKTSKGESILIVPTLTNPEKLSIAIP